MENRDCCLGHEHAWVGAEKYRQSVSEEVFARWRTSKDARCPLMHVGVLGVPVPQKTGAIVAPCRSTLLILNTTAARRNVAERVMCWPVRTPSSVAASVTCLGWIRRAMMS